MPIVLNAYFIIQLIILAICLGIWYLITAYFGIGNNINGDLALMIELLAAAVITGYTDVKGIKGRLFFIPTWIVCILGSLYILKTQFYGLESQYSLQVYISTAIILIVYYRLYKKEMRKNWERRKGLLDEFKNLSEFETSNTKKFWEMASQIYFKPPITFLFMNPLWKILYKNTLSESEFLEYYKELMSKINIDDLEKSREKRWVAELKRALTNADNFDQYTHPHLSLTRLGNIIDSMNRN